MTQDESQALALLSGYLKTKDGYRSLQYVEDETRGRDALTKILREGDRPIHPQIRQSLASLISVRSENPRILKFGRRKSATRARGANRLHDPVRDTSIAEQVYRTIKAGSTRAKALEIVGNKCGLSPERVKTIWHRQKWAFDRWGVD